MLFISMCCYNFIASLCSVHREIIKQYLVTSALDTNVVAQWSRVMQYKGAPRHLCLKSCLEKQVSQGIKCSRAEIFMLFSFGHDWEWASCLKLFRDKRFHHENPEGSNITLHYIVVPLSLYENGTFCGFGRHLCVIPTWAWGDTIICGSSQSRIIQHRTYDEPVISLWIQLLWAV